jgi:Transposase DDE domain
LLAASVAEVVTSSVPIPLLQRFTSVVVLDSSVVALLDTLADLYRGGRSGTTTGAKAAVKLTVGADIKAGTLLGPELSHGRAADLSAALAEAAPPPGGLQLADQNYFSLKKFAHWSREGAYWLSRFKAGTKVYDDQKQRIDLLARLRAAGDTDVDLDVVLGSQERVACRLIARRVPAEVAALRRKRLLDKCRKRGNKVSALSLALCDWTVLVTNVPRDLLNVEETIALARMRGRTTRFELTNVHATRRYGRLALACASRADQNLGTTSVSLR